MELQCIYFIDLRAILQISLLELFGSNVCLIPKLLFLYLTHTPNQVEDTLKYENNE
jgi:hypothetical protein